MHRATVVHRVSPGTVYLTIPSLFRDDWVGPVQSAVDAAPGDRVIVADLKPGARLRDWWVAGFESEIGRWGTPYAHTHPLGQVEGLVPALAAKADAPGAWTQVPLGTGWSAPLGSVEPGVGTSAGLWVRRSVTGLHLRMHAVPTETTGYPITLANLPAGLRPGWSATVPALANTGGAWQAAGVAVSAASGSVTLSAWNTATSVTGLSLTTILAVP